MALRYKVQCPDCGEKFQWEGARFPDFCPYCQTYVGTDPNFVPSRMNIGTVVSKGADATYRAIEESSYARAEMAGDPSLKITNMKDNLREGEVAAMPLQPSKTYQQAIPEGFNPWQGGMGISAPDAIAAAKNGPAQQHSGRVVLETIQGGRLPKVPNVPRADAGIMGLNAGFGGGG